MKNQRITARVLLLASMALCLCLAGCGGERPPGPQQRDGAMATISGAVSYRERMLLPPGAVVRVELQDVSRPDAMARVVAATTITPDTGPPYAFAISYDSDQLDARMTYGLRATIHAGDELLFTNTDFINAMSGNPVDVLVVRVPGQPGGAVDRD